MNNLKFKTVLGICDPKKLKPDILVFTRGATATITYDLSNKLNSLDTIEQISFLFKQGLNILSFNMFRYLIETEDEEVIEDKTYYTVTPISEDSLQVIATKVINPAGNPKEEGYYELTEIKDGENDLYWMLDEHFYLLDNVLTFKMFPEETKNLMLTTPMSLMRFEIAFRLNTDSSEMDKYRDSIVIESQQPIAVVDSIYSQITVGDDLTVNIRPNSVASIHKTVKE